MTRPPPPCRRGGDGLTTPIGVLGTGRAGSRAWVPTMCGPVWATAVEPPLCHGRLTCAGPSDAAQVSWVGLPTGSA